MDFKDVVRDRFSCKKYSDRKVDEKTLKSILEAGRLAPTAKTFKNNIYILLKNRNISLSLTPSPPADMAHRQY